MFCGYIRVSSVGKRGGDSFRSPDDQREAIEAYARSRGWEVECLPPDLDKKSNTGDRPSLNVAIAGVENGRYEGIIVYNFSRWFRDVELDKRFTRRVRDAGGDVFSTTEAFPVGAFGEFMRTINSANDALYRDRKSEEFLSIQSSLVAAGRWRAVPPTGYVKGKDGRLVFGDDWQDVREAFVMRAGGSNHAAIGERFGWTGARVAKVLRNRAYLGEVRLGDELLEGAHPAIVDVKIFDAVQALHGARPKVSHGTKLLTGILRCEACGYVMTSAPGSRPRYQCKPNRGAERCPAPAAIVASRIEEHVAAIARQELALLDVRAKAKVGVSRSELELALDEAEAELAAYLSAVSPRDVGEDAFKAAARERRQAVERARADLAAATIVTPLAALTGSAADGWDRWNLSQRNLALRGLLACVVVRRSGLRGTRIPVADRVRVYPAGADLSFPGPLPFGDGDDVLRLRVLGVED